MHFSLLCCLLLQTVPGPAQTKLERDHDDGRPGLRALSNLEIEFLLDLSDFDLSLLLQEVKEGKVTLTGIDRKNMLALLEKQSELRSEKKPSGISVFTHQKEVEKFVIQQLRIVMEKNKQNQKLGFLVEWILSNSKLFDVPLWHEKSSSEFRPVSRPNRATPIRLPGGGIGWVEEKESQETTGKKQSPSGVPSSVEDAKTPDGLPKPDDVTTFPQRFNPPFSEDFMRKANAEEARLEAQKDAAETRMKTVEADIKSLKDSIGTIWMVSVIDGVIYLVILYALLKKVRSLERRIAQK